MRSTMELGKRVCSSIQSASPGSFNRAKAVKLARATSPLPWTWSLEDIARQFLIEDRLFAHWTALFPERILVVPYEEMARDPQDWIPRILSHVGLPLEPQVFEPHKTKRGVRTASVRQVRQPIGTNRIGTAERYAAQLKPFTDIYYA